MTFQTYLTRSAIDINREVELILGDWQNKANKKTSATLSLLLKYFSESTKGGKCIRGVLVKLGYETAGGTDSVTILSVAAALEILHTSFLIQDDIIDRSDVRRGKSSLHTLLGNNHYGNSQAMLLADMGFFLANSVITEQAMSAKLKKDILLLFSDINLDTILGEILDVKVSEDTSITEETILSMYALKTAQYTITGPLSLGFLFAGKKNTSIPSFGTSLGIAFQIKNDIDGIFANSSDIEEGKKTLLWLYALQNSTIEQRTFLLQHYGSNASPAGCKKITEIFIETGALTYAMQKIQTYTAEAKTYIPSFAKTKTTQSLFYQLLSLIVPTSGSERIETGVPYKS